ncbi:hypothetical protein H5410_061356 [Solanum commersonii]|uniref:DUF7745 domain-containing protein n=1 Tax=Solanum commersonii TaxID=4109 RepID=A0A9J5W9D6_SOLCO|nr:hypothetical protein H5410_061356 [Solanum commersonii]
MFRFIDFEMTPTLEEIASFMEKEFSIRGADLRNKRPIVPNNVYAKKFLDLLKINQIENESLKNGWVSLDFLYERYGQKEGFENYQNQLSNQEGVEVWKVSGCFAFMVAFLELIVFPKRDNHIDIRLAGVVKALTTMESPTILPMILVDMFRALTKCIKGEMYFEGCNILLQIWFLEHLYHHDPCEEKLLVITSDEIVWNYYSFPAKDVICMFTGISFLMSIGLRGVQPNAPLRVMRQLARLQEVPPNDDMSRFVFETPLGFAFNSEDILKIWYESIISKQSEMVVEQDKGKVVRGYLSWFRDPVTFGDTPERSSRKRKDQHTIRQLEKELEKAEGFSHPSPTRSSNSNKKKSPIGVTRYGGGIEAYRGEISSIRGGAE